MATALDRHIALIGFMGAGKTTLGVRVASLIGREFFDLDREIEKSVRRTIPDLFRREGEAHFRLLERDEALRTLTRERPAVVALGGGAIETPAIRDALREHALTILLEVEPDAAWERVARSTRPLAQDPEEFQRLHRHRSSLYEEAADARAQDLDDVMLAALGVRIEPGARPHGDALIADPQALALHPLELPEVHPVREKTVEEAERLWRDLRIGRDGTIVGYGGGTTTDLAGFVAATYLRGVRWISAPTTLVGQVDAGIGGKTAVDLSEGKNLAGAFHYPDEVVIDPALIETLPDEERRAGMAEVVKTGLLAGLDMWNFPEDVMIRACAAYKSAVCLADPVEQGRRAILNLGHTFAHALEAASLYTVRHGDAVALGLLAALRLSGLPTDVVETVLDPRPVPVDRERAWEALKRDKKVRDGRIKLVLLEAPGRPVWGVERPEPEVRAALDALISI
ncbi:MAG TPA: bifunctional shikimate kinase/3-dehydroquinate synthase [Gaiellaceae bacterium]|nr:bifunctional shikimate kinase/3-dehydroquinate synthase [Gaiellaceae bacterium]